MDSVPELGTINGMATDGVGYVRVRDASIAYRVLGDRGPFLAILLGPFPGLLFAEHPATRASIEWACRFGRPVVFDVQGSGRSDPLPQGVAASVEDEAEQLIAVLTAAGIDTAYILGVDSGGAVGVTVAVRRPNLVSGLLLGNAYARAQRADDYPLGTDAAIFRQILQELHDRHGTGFLLELAAPSVAHDPQVREFWINCEQQMASPVQMVALARIAETLDVRSLLPKVRAPTVVMHSADDALYPIEHGRYLADHIPNARFVEMPGRDHIFLWESGEFFRDGAEAFVTGMRPTGKTDRALAAVLFTDLVASMEHARTFGDRRWRRLLDEFERVCAEQIEKFRGRVVKYTGDGMLAIFESASDAVRSATALIPAADRPGLEIRSGIHVGDIERRGEDVGGTAVNVAARVMESAVGSEVLVTSGVRDAAAGSGIGFLAAGSYELKDVAEGLLLYRADLDQP
jgi:class 3 adenylate cyclase/pimeloyl-ACP methyl ester carboxylesterase